MLHLARLPALSLLALLAATACNERRNPGGINNPGINKDATPKDGADIDEDGGTNGNPDANGNFDTGFPPFDSGVVDTGPIQDTGVTDTGTPPVGECTVNTDCTGTSPQYCLTFDQATGSLKDCAGATDCQCWQGCEPFVVVENSGCPRPAEACATAGAMSPTPGVCIADQGGGTQGMPCTTQWTGNDPTMGLTQDSCNALQNFYCHGADPLDIAGTCVRLCDSANPALCTALDAQSQCVVAPGQTRGLCLRPVNDLGTACTDPGMCQGAHCSTELGGQCSEQCGVTFQCAQSTGLCIYAMGQLSPQCVLECTVGAAGDTMCSGVNANLVCEEVAAGLSFCFPRCDDATNPCTAPMTCNAGTGHCQ